MSFCTLRDPRIGEQTLQYRKKAIDVLSECKMTFSANQEQVSNKNRHHIQC